MAPTGPRLCCCLLACLLLLGCFPASISAEVTATSSIKASSSASTAEQNRPSFLAAVLGGDARKKADSISEEGLEESASLKSIFGLGPKDLPDADSVDPTLVAIGMDSSSSVGTASMDTLRGSKHSHHSGSTDTSYDSSSNSKQESSAEEEALLQAFDAEEEEQQRQHHKQHQHRQKGLGWVLGRRSAKGAKDKDSSGHHKDKDKDKSKEGTAAGSSGVNAGAAFVEKRIKPLLAAIKSKAPNLGRGKNRRYAGLHAHLICNQTFVHPHPYTYLVKKNSAVIHHQACAEAQQGGGAPFCNQSCPVHLPHLSAAVVDTQVHPGRGRGNCQDHVSRGQAAAAAAGRHRCQQQRQRRPGASRQQQ